MHAQARPLGAGVSSAGGVRGAMASADPSPTTGTVARRRTRKLVSQAEKLSSPRGAPQALHLLAAAADVMVTVNSTSGAEALTVGCPVINARLTDVDLSPFVEATDTVPEVYNVAQLREALDGILSHSVDPTRVGGGNRECVLQVGRASQAARR